MSEAADKIRQRPRTMSARVDKICRGGTALRVRKIFVLVSVVACARLQPTASSKPSAHAMAESDRAAIVSTIKDYFEGWFDGDATRMERALHPALVKRGIKRDGSISPATAQEMIEYTKKGEGKAQRPADLALEITVDDVYGDIATATVYSAIYIEYVHLVKTPAGWRILNTLYKRRT
jgi:hypothetical protein